MNIAYNCLSCLIGGVSNTPAIVPIPFLSLSTLCYIRIAGISRFSNSILFN